MINNPNFKLIRKLRWEEVFLFWYECEGKSENWIKHATEERGYASWAEWRLEGYAIPFDCANAEWGLYEVSEPTKEVLKFRGGPFRTWIKVHYGGTKSKTFAELAKQPDIKNHSGVRSMVNNFPKDKVISCLMVDDEIFVVEGSHRTCSLAVMNEEDIEFPEKLTFAIGKSKLKELPIVGQVDK